MRAALRRFIRPVTLSVGVVLVGGATGARAQPPPGVAPPMASAELQAVYCESVLQNDLSLLQQMLDAARTSAAHADDIPAGVRQHVLESLRRTQDELPLAMQARRSALEHVQAFLAPRRRKLDASSVGVAQERAEEDISAMGAMANRCATQCEAPTAGVSADTCSRDCLGKELPGRLDRCRKPTWLP